MKQYFVFLMLLFALILGSCEKVTFEPISDVPDDLSLSDDIQPIFNSNCISCHGGDRNPDLREVNAYGSLVNGGYIDTKDPENSKIIQVLNSSHSSRASEKEKAYILGWIKQGAKDN